MDNQAFLQIVGESFKKFLEKGSRSNEKLKILHGAIAKDIQDRLGRDGTYSVLSLEVGGGSEATISGRYIDKKVDITILQNKTPIAGIGVKFVMQNYSQNSNNYFENMLGETANIRSSNIPYFQIFIIPDKMPYYDRSGNIQKWESFTKHNSSKYLKLSEDNILTSVHTPTKTLLFVVHIQDINTTITDKATYVKEYKRASFNDLITESDYSYGIFSNSVIYNDYETFIKKLVHYINFL